MKSLLFLFLLFNLYCSPPSYLENDPNFTYGLESILSYKGEIFTGFQVTPFPNGITRTAEFKNGLQDGRTFDIHQNGQLMSEYFYSAGKKVGIHKGWYPGGNPRFWFEYNDKGESNRDHWEWQENGNVYSIFSYDNGKLIGQKVWRKDGLVYANTIYTTEKVYGVVGSKLCLTVKGDDSKKKTKSF